MLNLLFPLLPLTAKVIVEVGTSDMEERYRPLNPQVQYLHLDNFHIESAIPKGEIDCLVFSNITAIPGESGGNLLRQFSQWLHPEGQVLVAFSNAQYWQHLTALLSGEANAQDCLTLIQMEKLFTEAGLLSYELIKEEMPLPPDQQPAFEEFQRQILPLLQSLNIEPAFFRAISNSATLVLRGLCQPFTGQKLLLQTCITAPVGCDRVRVLEPDRFTASILGTRTMNIRVGQSIQLNIAHGDEEKVFIWQRALLLYPKDIAKQKLLLQKGYLIVAEHDDDPFFWPENADNKFLLFWSSHCIQTSTEALADHLQQFGNPFVQVFRNHLAYLPAPREYTESYTINLFFGALNRQQDWEPLMPIINRVLTRHKQVFVKVIHDRQFYNALATSRKEFQPFLPYEDYQNILRSCDIGILPLNDTQFNRMKSDLKFLEHAGHGVAALASPTVYGQSILEGETGMIYRSPEEFGEKLTELIQNTALRQKIARNAYTWVRENRLLCQHFQERRSWYLEMRSQLPALNASLRERCPQMFE